MAHLPSKYNPATLDLSNILEEAQALANRPRVEYQVLMPLRACPPLPVIKDEYWLTVAETNEWLRYWYPETQHPQHSGGLLLTIRARDIYSVLAEADEWADRLSSRFRVGARKRLEFLPQIFLLGEPEPLVYPSSPRRVEVLSLERTSEVFHLQLSPQIDAALELMAALDRGTRTTAVAGSWAAIESLLVGPGDTMNRVVAATRAARIVACSYVRAEFSALTNSYIAHVDDELSSRLQAVSNSEERALIIERHMRDGLPLNLTESRSIAAVHRMQDLMSDPGSILPRVVNQLEDSFRRLYRQRNLIVHSGQTSSIALQGTLRTVAPLVGAGVDRIVHANAVRSLSPLMIAAIAEINLERAAHDTSQDLVRLLDWSSGAFVGRRAPA